MYTSRNVALELPHFLTLVLLCCLKMLIVMMPVVLSIRLSFMYGTEVKYVMRIQLFNCPAKQDRKIFLSTPLDKIYLQGRHLHQ